MKFSSQEEYGLRCLLQLARLGAGESLTIPQITANEGLTEPNVAKLLGLLRRDGFIVSTRGQSGGYRLARPAEEILIGDVLNSLGGRLYDDGFCDRHGGADEQCVHLNNCSLTALWGRIQSAVDKVIYQVSLADLVADGAMQPTVSLRSMSTFKRPKAGGRL